MMHSMTLWDEPFCLIESGIKTIELRLFDEKRQNIKVGDIIEFTNLKSQKTLRVLVRKLYRFKDFKELYNSLDLLKCGYTKSDIDSARASDMDKYYSKQQQEQYGVLGIEIEKM